MIARSHTGAFRVLRFAGIVAISGLGVAAFLIVGSYLYLQSEKKADIASQRSLQDFQARLQNIRREREDLQGSEETYKSLIVRGAFAPEQRLDLIEALDQLRKRHHLVSLEYEVSAQRPLKFANGTNYTAVNIFGSRIRIKAQTYHDGDLLAFLDEFPRIQRGFFPIDRCAIKRVGGVEQRAQVSPADGGQPVAEASPNAVAVSVAALEADCTLEWVTLVDKSKPAGMQAAVDSRKPL